MPFLLYLSSVTALALTLLNIFNCIFFPLHEKNLSILDSSFKYIRFNFSNIFIMVAL